MVEKVPSTGSGMDFEALAALPDDDLVSRTLAADRNGNDPEIVLFDMLQSRKADSDYTPDPVTDEYVAGLREIARRAVSHFGLTQQELFGEE